MIIINKLHPCHRLVGSFTWLIGWYKQYKHFCRHSITIFCLVICFYTAVTLFLSHCLAFRWYANENKKLLTLKCWVTHSSRSPKKKYMQYTTHTIEWSIFNRFNGFFRFCTNCGGICFVRTRLVQSIQFTWILWSEFESIWCCFAVRSTKKNC